MNCKTGAEHIRSLQDGRTVYLDGKPVGDVTVHPAFRNSVKSAAMLYDFQAQPQNIELMTFQPNGANRRVNRAWQMPRNYAEMVQRRKAMQAWAQLSYGFMGRSPDHLASSVIGQVMGIEVFEKHGPARAKALKDYYEEASRNDWFLTYVIINPQAERAKDWGEQAEDLVARIVDEDAGGITIRGAKMLGTSSIMANEVFVANLQPLKPGEEALAFSCAVPMNARGLRVLSRKSYEAAAVSVFDNPISSRFDENDALIYFDDVKVPWERVFVHRDPDMCRAQFHDTPGHAYQNYQAQIRLSVKIKFLCGLAHRITEAIGTTNMPPVREQLGFLAAQVSMVNAMMAGMEAEGTMRGEWYVPNRHYMYSAQVLTQDLYPKVINTLRDLSGGALIMLPSSIHDFADPQLVKIINATQRAAKMSPEQKVKFLKAAWDAIGSEFGSRHTQYEMFYAGARFVTTGHSYRTFDWAEATGMVDRLMDSYQLSDELWHAEMKIAIVNLGQIVSGNWRDPFAFGDTIVTEGERIMSVGTATAGVVESADVVIDAGGMTAIPGLIDSHVHVTFGDYTPRQRTVGYLESYLHGGTTTAISASEVHVPGRPRDVEGVKALAVAAQRCFADYRPGGMRVIAGSVILEPGLIEKDFRELAQKGVRLAKAGFGAVRTAYDYVPMVADARSAGLITTCHTGGSSIPGSGAITGDHLLKMHPHVSFHINGGPTAMPDRDFERVIRESEIALQVCTAGNLRTTLLCARLAEQHGAFDRFIVATDTPTGSGIMPLGMLYTIAHLASLTDMAPERFICAASGSNARVYGLDSGLLAPGKAADIVLIDAPDGGTQSTALTAIKHGDIAAIGAVVTAGVPRFVGRSRNTPATTHKARVAVSRVTQDFAAS